VLERVFSLLSVCAHRGLYNHDALFYTWRVEISDLMHMCVHGMWPDDAELKEIPHFEYDVSCSIKLQDPWLIHTSGH
jgi:hypothetical protein